MKRAVLLTVWGCAAALNARAEFVDPFQEAFQGMFELVEHPYVPEGYMDEPPPPGVPLDGGLTALVLAGGGVAYRRFKQAARRS